MWHIILILLYYPAKQVMRTHTCISMDITPKSNNYVCISLTFIGESPIGSWNVLKAQTESFVFETTIEQNLSPWKPPCYFNFFFSFSFFITNDLRNLNLIFYSQLLEFHSLHPFSRLELCAHSIPAW